jgi:2-dehydro-3-deoxy-D-gluconate 5-dehydrogenase
MIQPIAELFDLTGKGALIIGGATGIGQGIAFRLAQAGASVMIGDIDLEEAEKSAQQIKNSGGKAQAIYADAGSVADAKKTTQAAVQAFGRLDILINNVGLRPYSPLMEISEQLWDKVLDANLKGTFFYSQAVAEKMIKAGHGGRIINMTSIAGLDTSGGALPYYNASKAGVVMLTKALALEFAPHKILVNAIAPGAISTPGSDKGFQLRAQAIGKPVEEILEGWAKRIPLGHRGQPDDIAKVVLFLASAAADYMTGSIILVDGGYLLQ